ncbi:MAG: hypothetical protein F6K19_09620 [Cyanothece sp. SIO1E1]|nr:hypothetical protein [Cyanothece sp. SIO1E1]
MVTSFLRSLLLTAFFSFTAPIALLGVSMMGLFLLGYLPALQVFSQISLEQITYFLIIFGNGSSLQGLFVMSSTFSLVSILFDAFTFYRYQNLREY